MSKIEYIKDSFPEYLGQKDRVSASDLKNFLHSPSHYFYDKFVKEPRPQEKHFAIGSALHECILEPHEFKNHYIISPKFDRRTKQGKEDYEQFEINANGKTVITVDEMDMIIKIAENAIKNDTLTELIRDSQRELSCYTIDEKTGLELKLRPDSMKAKTITDIKSCIDSSPKEFRRDVYNYGYSITGAYYADFLGMDRYIFCAMEKTPPHNVSLYQLSDEMMDYGRKQYRMGLDLLRWSIDNDFWCDYVQFQILKECYELETLDNFFDTLERSDKIMILN